jgi:hypothetical protein
VQLQFPMQILRNPSCQLDPYLVRCHRVFPSLCGAI